MKNSYPSITDQFCGAGGSSIGATLAGGEVRLALNHWKLAVQTHNTNFPNTDHDCADMSATDPRRYPSTRILITSPECFPAGSLVLTRAGFVPIENISIGDLVLTHKNRWMRVVRTQSKQAEETVIVSGQGHTHGIEATPNHKFYARRQGQKWDNLKRDYDRRVFGEPDWVRADELTSSKYRWSTPVKVMQDFEDIVIPPGLGELAADSWWLIGRWLGDGSLSFGRHSDVTISCGKHEESELVDRLSKTGANWRRYIKRTAINFTLTNRDLRDWLFSTFGHGAANKTIPGWAIGLDVELRTQLLAGYVSADGSISERRTRIDTVSKSLAFSVRLLAESLGYRAGAYLYEQHCSSIEGRELNVLPIWVVAWENNSSERAAFVDGDLSWGLVKEVRPGRKDVTVYNIEVEEDHSYVVEGIVVKNCTNHSLAKGVARRLYERDLFGNVFIDPAAERSRATMWDVPRFAEYHKYDIIITENVVDAANWRLFESWLFTMYNLDYLHEIVYFNSMYAMPTPQSRDRMYIVLWKKGIRKPNLDFCPIAHCLNCGKDVPAIQTWKKKRKWGRYKSQYFYRCSGCNLRVDPYYFAGMNAIDFSISAVRIGDRPIPLKPKTMARVKYGFERYGRTPLIVTGRYTTGIDCRVKDAMTDVIPTQPGDSSHAVALPWMVQTDFTKGNGQYVKNSVDPLATQSTRESLGVVMPWFVETGYTHSGDNRVDPVSDAMNTQSTHQTIGLVAPGFLSKQYGGAADPKNMGVGLDAPTGSITTWDHHALITPGFMVPQNSNDNHSLPSRSMPLSNPTKTVVSDDNHAFVGMPQPKQALVAPSFIANMRGGGSTASAIGDPLLCVTSTGCHHALLSPAAFMSYYYGTYQAGSMADPIRTMTGLDRAALIGALEKLTVEDLTFRMLAPREIGAAMAFPSTYKVLGTNREMTKQYGNAVTPPVMQMIIARCIEVLA